MGNALIAKQKTAVREMSWIDYLVAAYPSAKATPQTLFVYDTQFTDVPPALMFQVAQEAVRRHRFNSLPTPGELHAILEAMQAPTAAPELRQVGNLNARRHALMQRAYAGDVDADAWQQLIDDLWLARRPHGATAAQGFLARVTQ